MEMHDVGSGADSAPRWYSRAAFDEFNAAADRERSRLEAVIADASARLARADATVGLNRTMSEMLLRSQQEIQVIRRDAEAVAASILEGHGEVETVARAGSASDDVLSAQDEPGAPVDAYGFDPDASLEPDEADDDRYFSRIKDTLGDREGLGSLNDD